MVNKIEKNIENSISLLNFVLNSKEILTSCSEVVNLIVNCYNNKQKIYFCGNGGSFADAQHLSAELSGKFYFDRKPLEVVLLASNLSYLTAVANDYNYEDIFLRELAASCNANDILICFSTSGLSKNLIKVVNFAKKQSIKTICFLGRDGGNLKNIADYSIVVPSYDTARIQEIHVFLGHSILQEVEEKLFNK